MKNPTESLEHASAPDSGGTDSGAGRRRLHRAERTGRVDRRLRYGQKPSGDGLVSGRVPTEAAGLIHHGGGSGGWVGRSEAEQSSPAADDSLAEVRADRAG